MNRMEERRDGVEKGMERGLQPASMRGVELAYMRVRVDISDRDCLGVVSQFTVKRAEGRGPVFARAQRHAENANGVPPYSPRLPDAIGLPWVERQILGNLEGVVAAMPENKKEIFDRITG